MKKPFRTLLLGLGIAAVSGLSLAADQPAAAAKPAAPAATPATNVQTPTTTHAKKKVKRHKKTHHAQPAAKKPAA